MKLVLDTDVVVAAFRSQTGASAAIIGHAVEGDCRIAASNAMLFEYEAVLGRAEHLAAAGKTPQDAIEFFNIVADLAEPVTIDFVWRPQVRDPDDEAIMDAAINAGAAAIVTFNLRDFGIAPPRFGIDCLLPREALERIR
jgi:putative PIN family toxin of toxin-antitoxin system